MGLETYRQKRDFARTPEPRGAARRKPGAALQFVIQEHAARQLHHDFRLELDGVLKSWAVPKGPPRTRGERRLAVQTEDHPLAYADFEGKIPKGSYGAGTVKLWDRGSWHPEGDPRSALDEGKLHFRLEGQRLRGRWSLVRGGKDWLLIKRSDPLGTARGAPRGAARQTKQSKRGSVRHAAAGADHAPGSPGDLPGARRLGRPPALRPQLATLAKAAPEGSDWLHELKYDGYRLLARMVDGEVRLQTRGGKDWTKRFEPIAAALQALPVDAAIFDGEVVVFAPDGTTDFQALQNAMRAGEAAAAPVYVVFDLPWVDGWDLRRVALIERKGQLARLLDAVDNAASRRRVRYSDHVRGDGPAFLAHACGLSLEGAVSKRADAPYTPGRTRSWLKSKCGGRQEFVVGGWSEPGGSRRHLGALLLGTFDGQGRLRYAGKVGTGFDAEALADLAGRLAPLATRKNPFASGDPPDGQDIHWVQPREVVEVSFTEWTDDGRLRHPVYQGRREDKSAAAVRREQPGRDAKGKGNGAGGATATGAASVAGVRLSHPDRVLFPEAGLTKAALAAYYQAVAEPMLPHLAGRPLSLVRCPRGRAKSCFYQKHPGDGTPDEVRQFELGDQAKVEVYLGVDDLAGVIALVQLGTLELHPWGCRADRPDRPDRMIFDLDPGPGVTWRRVVEAAHALRELLDELGLTSFARTTGGKGLHVVVPIQRRSSWDEVKRFTRDCAATLAARAGQGFVLSASKSRRNGRIYIDVLRNARGATAVGNYSSRARKGAPVACPVTWDELTPDLAPGDFTVTTVPGMPRLEQDPWTGFFDLRQSLTRAMREAVAKA